MIERCHKPLIWYDRGPIEKVASGGAVIKDLHVRWNEQITDDGYVYDACRFDYTLPVGVQPGDEAVDYFLEQAKDYIVQLAQDMAIQEAGFLG